MKRLHLLPIAALAALVAGCGTPTLAESDIEEQAEDVLEDAVGVRPEVDCPDDLVAEVGETLECTLTAPDGSQLGTTITVTEVDGDTVLFDVEVEEG